MPILCRYGFLYHLVALPVDSSDSACFSGLLFFTGSICGVAFVLLDGKGEYSNGPALFLAITSSALSVSFGSLFSIFNRQSVYDVIHV